MIPASIGSAYTGLPGPQRKNDDIFTLGAQSVLPFVFSYIQPDVEVVYGPACKPGREINEEACFTDGVSMLPRRGGGGTVVLSPGMVITVVVGHRAAGSGPIDIFGHVHDAMIALLTERFPIVVEKAGISDLAVNGKKVLGSSLYLQQRPQLYYYASSLMVDSDISLLNRYLAYPPKEPVYRCGRNHDSFCSTLVNEGFSVTAADVATLFSSKLGRMI